MKPKPMMRSFEIPALLVFGILSNGGCSIFNNIENNQVYQNITLNTVQERVQHIQIALKQREFTKARRLTEMVLLEVQWIEVSSSQKLKSLTALTQEAINEKKSKKFTA